MVWRTESGVLVCDGKDEPAFYVVRPDASAIVATFQPGAFSYEDELYKWRFEVDGAQLVKQQTVEHWGSGDKHSTEVELDDLEQVPEAEASKFRQGLGVLIAERDGVLRSEARARATATAERQRSLLAALPSAVTKVYFRRDGKGWTVGLEDGSVFWSTYDFPWRGKDLHSELATVLRKERPDVTLAVDLVTEEDWAWYAAD